MVHVASEVGEVADAVLALCEAGEEDINAARTALGHEIFDVIWNLCALANATGVDVEDAACEKVALNADREWRPARTATRVSQYPSTSTPHPGMS
ncbi:MAG: MazG-like family protein [Actinomycetia bacterium]|nr:MazG-like family protein [Actinomycetes bacterium]